MRWLLRARRQRIPDPSAVVTIREVVAEVSVAPPLVSQPPIERTETIDQYAPTVQPTVRKVVTPRTIAQQGKGKRRSLSRVETSLTGEFVESSTDLATTGECLIEEITSGGLRIRTHATLYVGSVLDVSFVLPGDVRSTRVGVEVVATAQSPDGSSLVECNFKELSRSAFGHILSWMAKQDF